MLIFLLIIQIITESLPISSSGHVALAQGFLQQHGYDVLVPSALLWLVHGITLLLMLFIMRRSWWPLLCHPWRMRAMIVRMALYGLCAEVITVVVYGALYARVHSCDGLALGFLITTLVLWSLKFCKNVPQYSSLFVWIMVGVAQGVAVIPGCSRLALTYAMARWLGYSGRHALALSFTMALPLFAAASVYGAYDIFYSQASRDMLTPLFFMGCALASVFAYGALLLTCHVMTTDRVRYFAGYMTLLFLLAVVVKLLQA